ncbi:hypothetical protein L596_007202 [Steinernema carpocapsae]|uniref:Transmembrane protein 107 n=1 Tax=Steinernema carpocapsae TaxID=34508 RepID=A0A4U5P9K8_STECR|nr:hypothetical protein L596_007202 [Steinernema carpocapsae]
MELMTSGIISLIAHAGIVFTLFWSKADHIGSSLSIEDNSEESWELIDASLTVNLTLTLVLILLEVLFMIRHVLRPFLVIVTLFSHTAASIILLKVVIDKHPVPHLWILSSICCGLPVVLHLITFTLSFRRSRFC